MWGYVEMGARLGARQQHRLQCSWVSMCGSVTRGTGGRWTGVWLSEHICGSPGVVCMGLCGCVSVCGNTAVGADKRLGGCGCGAALASEHSAGMLSVCGARTGWACVGD